MATYYVATNGSNGNPGSSVSPWATIDYAAAAARNLQPGDTVIVRSGTYNTTGVTIGHSGSAGGGKVTFKSDVLHGAKVVSSGQNGFYTNNKHHVRIEGFDVTAVKTGINIGKGCYYIDVVNNRSHDNDAQGIYSRQSEFLLIEGNIVYNNSTNNQANNSISVHFMENVSGDTTTTGFRMIVRGNTCYNNGINTTSTDSGGIMIDSNPTDNFTPPALYTYPRLVENNLCYRNGGPGIIVLEALNTTVRNNTCWQNGRKPGAGGFTANLVNRTDNIVWANNIAVADKAFNPNSPAVACVSLADRVPRTYVNVDWYNNITFNGVNGEESLFQTGNNAGNLPSAADDNMLGVNPRLVSPLTDFHPAPGSPAIDAGTSAHNGASSIDFEGTTRVAPVDIGAFEHAASSGGTMAPDSVICAIAVARGVTTDMLAEVGLGGTFVTRTTRNTPAPAVYIADTNNDVQDTFGPVAKVFANPSLGSIAAVFSMKPLG